MKLIPCPLIEFKSHSSVCKIFKQNIQRSLNHAYVIWVKAVNLRFLACHCLNIRLHFILYFSHSLKCVYKIFRQYLQYLQTFSEVEQEHLARQIQSYSPCWGCLYEYLKRLTLFFLHSGMDC